jgi:hypothetical protein
MTIATRKRCSSNLQDQSTGSSPEYAYTLFHIVVTD